MLATKTRLQSVRRMVYIYDGEGAKPTSRVLLQSSMEHCLCPRTHTVTRITPEQIKKGDWRDGCAAVILGGGYDLGFIKALGHSGVKVLRDFVLDGGTYIGFCAGGYFGCDSIEFDKGGKLEVCGERQLKFYPGKCIGPVVAGFKYDTDKGLDALSIKFHATESTGNAKEYSFQTYVNGGGYFAPYSTSLRNRCPDVYRVETLATYTTLPHQPPAIVRCEVGKKGGVAVLTGPHPEFSAYELDASDADLQKHLPGLLRCEGVREKCLKQLLRAANLKVKLKEDSVQ
ncbi:hypothetical protein BaRGS_00031574, partial [Batillaria attramentaria]